MTSSSYANGARLDDCHSTIFSLADLSGIQWRKFTSSSTGLNDDPVLSAFTECLASDILAVWRRSPKKSSINELCEKELWIFWWGEEPSVNEISQQKGMREESGCWEKGLSYECRSLLFKAIHNLVERCLLHEGYVRVGRWFIKPFSKETEEDISDRFSFSFSFFLHGESSVCTTVQVARHQTLERLSYQHVQKVLSNLQQNRTVVLAPFGLEAKLTGQVYRSPHDPMVKKLMEEWSPFYPLASSEDVLPDEEASDDDGFDDHVPVPPVVEVVVGGIQMNYPSYFVLVPLNEESTTNKTALPNKILASQITEKDAVNNDKASSDTLALSNGVVKRVQSGSHKGTRKCSAAATATLRCLPSDTLESNTTSEVSHKSAIQKRLPKHRDFGDTYRSIRAHFTENHSGNLSVEERKGRGGRPSPSHAFHHRSTNNETTNSTNLAPQSRSATLPMQRNSDPVDPGNASTLLMNFDLKQQVDDTMMTPLHENKMVQCGKQLGVGLHSRPFVNLEFPQPQWENENVAQTLPQSDLAEMDNMDDIIEIKQVVEEWKTYKLPINCDEAGKDHHASKVMLRDSLDPGLHAGFVHQTVMDAATSKQYLCSGPKKIKLSLDEIESNMENKVDAFWSAGINQTVSKETLNQQILVGTVKGELAGMMVPSDPYAFDDDIEDTWTSNNLSSSDINLKNLSTSQQSFWPSQTAWTQEHKTATGTCASEIGAITTENHHAGKSQLEALLTNSPLPCSDPGGTTTIYHHPTRMSESDLKFSMDDLEGGMFEEDEETGAPTPPDDPGEVNSCKGIHYHPATSTAADITNNVDLQTIYPTPPSLEPYQAFSPEIRSNMPLSNENILSSEQSNSCPLKKGPVETQQQQQLQQQQQQQPPPPPQQQDLSLKMGSNNIQLSSLTKMQTESQMHHTYENYPTPLVYVPVKCLTVNLPRNTMSYTPTWQLPTTLVQPPPTYTLPATNEEFLGFQPLTPATPATCVRTPGTPGRTSVKTPASVQASQQSPAQLSVPTPRTPGRSGIRSVDQMDSSVSSMATPTSLVTPKHNYFDQHGSAAIYMNLWLSDSVFNLFRDHSFDQCALCICNSNIAGADVEFGYLPALSTEEPQFMCSCGFSAVRNRMASIGSGLFLEDELDVVGKKFENVILESREAEFHKQQFSQQSKLSPKLNKTEDEIVRIVLEHYSSPFNADDICNPVLRTQFSSSSNNVVVKNDISEAFTQALNNSLSAMEPSVKAEFDVLSQPPIHMWNETESDVLVSASTFDVFRLLLSLKPVLQDAIQKKRTSRSYGTTQHVKGPLTWREFCKEAGKNAEPQPIPSITVGYDQDWLNVSPQALNYWEKLFFEPYSRPRDVGYIVVCPDNDDVATAAKMFFKELCSVYESCRLGRLKPINRVLRDSGILRVSQESLTPPYISNDDWFQQYIDSVKLKWTDKSVCEESINQLMQFVKSTCDTLAPLLNSESSLELMSLHVRDNRSRQHNPTLNHHSSIGVNFLSSSSSSSSPSCSSEKEPRSNLTSYNPSTAASIVIYFLDPFNGSLSRGLWQCFLLLQKCLSKPLCDHVFFQVIPVEKVLLSTNSSDQGSLIRDIRSLAFNTFSRCRKNMHYVNTIKSMTGFGPAASEKETLHNVNRESASLFSPPYILSLPRDRHIESSVISNNERKCNILFVSYCLSHNQKYVLASATDQCGEILETCCINIEVPLRRLLVSRKNRISVRGEAIRKLWEFCTCVTSKLSTESWRIVVGRLGRLSHGEICDWARFLNRKNLVLSGQRSHCPQCKLQHSGESSFIVSACLISLEPDDALMLMPDVVQANNFGRSSNSSSQNAQLNTPDDISCTHIYVFPTSADTQVPGTNYQTANGEDPYLGQTGQELILPDVIDGLTEDDEILNDLLNVNFMVPISPKEDDAAKPPAAEPLLPIDSPAPEEAQLSQQPLALGYLVSTAPPGPLPSWFWNTCPSAKHRIPVFFRSALHIQATSCEASSAIGCSTEQHPLDSNKTAVVLRYVLESYNSLSWLSRDPTTRDRRSCLPVHCLSLMQLYHIFQNLL